MQAENQRDQQHRQAAEQGRTQPDVGGAVSAGPGPAIGDLSEQDARRGHHLLKGQGTTHQQPREAQLREHHPIEHPDKDHRQTAQAPLEQPQTDQTRKRKRQLQSLSWSLTLVGLSPSSWPPDRERSRPAAGAQAGQERCRSRPQAA